MILCAETSLSFDADRQRCYRSVAISCHYLKYIFAIRICLFVCRLELYKERLTSPWSRESNEQYG